MQAPTRKEKLKIQEGGKTIMKKTWGRRKKVSKAQVWTSRREEILMARNGNRRYWD
jgi:hypothetical protein